MRIAINTRLLLPHKLDGIGWFTAETSKRMAQLHPEHTFYFLFDRKPAPDFIGMDNIVPLVLYPQARHPILWQLFFEVAVPAALRKHHIDVLLSPDGMIPLHTTVPTLSVIHDLNFAHQQGVIRRSHQQYMNHFYPRFAKKSTRIATVSEYSKSDIAATYGIEHRKIDVVYDGSHNDYRPYSDEEKAAIRRHYTNGSPYLIFVSTILKRKNLQGLLRAFDLVRQDDTRNLKLVVVGHRSWWGEELSKVYDTMQYRDDVIMLGRVDSDKLSGLLSASEALVYPSYFEGFGIPILEAMYAETAVICSNTTSMPEVGGDAVLYCDPSSEDSIAHAIRQLRDATLRNELIAKGRVQREKFSWDKTANLLWASLMQTVNQA